MTLTAGNVEAMADVADSLRVPFDWLNALVKFETAGTYDPQIKNPNSSARGLLQFTDAAARGLGFASSLDLVTRYPDFTEQIRGPVAAYLSAAAPFSDFQNFTMAVFYPAYRNKPAGTLFPPAVVAANPGIETPEDYMALVTRGADWETREITLPEIAIKGTGPAVALAGVGFFGLLLLLAPRRKK
jgi:hypothetical protein